MKKCILLILAMLLVFTACESGVKEVDTDNSEIINSLKADFPRIDGSTATIPLSESMVARIFDVTLEEAAEMVEHNTTHFAYENLIKGNADIIFVTPPSEDELNMAKEAGIELEVIPIVNDAFVFLNNTKNPVDNLTLEEVKDIYSGKIKNWSEVGGNDAEIIPYQREANSGSQTLMEKLVMNGEKMIDPEVKQIEGMAGLIDIVADYDNGENSLGYSVYYYAYLMYGNENIRLMSINGVKPTDSTISKNEYPLNSPYYAVINADTPENSQERKLIEFIKSEEGQRIAVENGYVSLYELK